MKTLKEWLERKPKGPAPRRPLPRSTKRIAPIGAKAKRTAGEYRAAVLAHLRQNPHCQIGPVIKAAGFDVLCLDTATHVHHTRGRGRFLCDRTTFRSSCSGECHPQWVHASNVAEATALGLLLPRK